MGLASYKNIYKTDKKDMDNKDVKKASLGKDTQDGLILKAENKTIYEIHKKTNVSNYYGFVQGGVAFHLYGHETFVNETIVNGESIAVII